MLRSWNCCCVCQTLTDISCTKPLNVSYHSLYLTSDESAAVTGFGPKCKTFTTNQRQSSGRAPSSSSSSSTACPVTGLWDSAGAGESGCHSLCLRRVDSFTADIKLICCEVWARGCAANEAGQWQLEIRRRLQLNRCSYRATVAVPSSPHTHTHTHTHSRGVKFNAFVPCMLFGCALLD